MMEQLNCDELRNKIIDIETWHILYGLTKPDWFSELNCRTSYIY